MEPAAYPPAHSCAFCQQFVIEFNGDLTTSSKQTIDGLKNLQVRDALRSRKFDQSPEVLEALQKFHIFDYFVGDLGSAPRTCPLADIFRKCVPVAEEYRPLVYPPEQTILVAQGSIHDCGLTFGALEIYEGQIMGPDMKETTQVSCATVAVFDVVEVPGSASSEKFGLSPVNNDPNAAFVNKLSRSWLTTCLETHKSCPKPSKTWMPTRLLKISRTPSGLQCQLHATEIGIVEPYAALSYCWGGPQPVLTTMDNLNEHLAGIDVNKLPKSLQDALMVTEALGLSYLWIDALCIIQDNKSDISIHIATMAPVYLNATVVIGASRSKAVQDGFLGPRLPSGENYSGTEAIINMRFRRTSGQERSMLAVPFTNAPFEPIDSRAWTYQERLLSLRFLEYGSIQTQWFCSGTSENEVWVDGLDRPTLSNNMTLMDAHAIMRDPTRSLGDDHDHQLFGLWEGIIMAHSARQITVVTDRLPALAGIAQRFAEALKVAGDEYLCGSWKGDLAHLLMWLAPSYEHQPPSTPYIAPSWSWVSMNGPIQFYTRQHLPFARFERQTHRSFEFVSHDIKLVDENSPFGAVISGSMKVKGILTPAEWDRSKPVEQGWEMKFGSTTVSDNDLWPMTEQELGEEIYHVSLLAVRETPDRCVEGLILRADDKGRFSRLGTFCYLHQNDNSSLAKLLWSEASEALVVELI